MIQVLRYTITAVITLVVLLLLWQFSVAIVLFLLSLAVAAALRPLINSIMGRSMMGRNISKRLALGIVYFLLVASIVGSLVLMGPLFLEDLQTASDDFVANYDRAKTEWPTSGTLFQKTLAEQLPPSADFYQALDNARKGFPRYRVSLGSPKIFSPCLAALAS